MNKAGFSRCGEAGTQTGPKPEANEFYEAALRSPADAAAIPALSMVVSPCPEQERF